MPLITEVKASSNQVANPVNNRTEVKFGAPKPTTARVDALKAKLNAPQTTQQAPPRVAGSSARAEQYAKLKNQSGVVEKPQLETKKQPLQDVEPPPSQPHAEEKVTQLDNNVEKVEQSPEVTDEEPSPQLVALLKKERQLRKIQQEFKAEQEAWKTEQASFVNKDLLKSDPLKALAEAGISYEKLTELQLGQIAPDPNQELLNKIASLEAKLAGVDEQFTKRDTASYNAAVNQIRNDAKLLIDSDAAYETIKATGETEAVVDLIRKVFDAEGTILSVEESAKMVEEKLLERKLEEVEKLLTLSKIKTRLAKPSETEEVKTPQQGQKQITLSNNAAVARPLTARERAIMAFENSKIKA